MGAAAGDQPRPRFDAQSVWLLSFLFFVVAFCLLTDLVARNRNLERWQMARSSALSQRNGKLFSNTGNFLDYEERLLLDEIPNTDFSKGGVYFFGTSNMKWAFTTWDLPTFQRDRLHDYGIGASTHETALRLVRYLIDRGALSAQHKNEVVIGASFHLGATETPNSYFPALLRRQGLYAIGPDDRLVETKISPVERWWRTEKARSGGFIWNMVRLGNNWFLASFDLSHQPPHDPEAYREAWREYMGPGWQSNIDREVGYLRETLVLLHSKGVPAKVVFLPQGTWMNGLPFGPYYESQVRALCQETSTPLIDWSHSISDADFIDSNHLTVAGQTKLRNMILKEEAPYLR